MPSRTASGRPGRVDDHRDGPSAGGRRPPACARTHPADSTARGPARYRHALPGRLRERAAAPRRRPRSPPFAAFSLSLSPSSSARLRRRRLEPTRTERHEAVHASGIDDQPPGAPADRRARPRGRGGDGRPDGRRPLPAAVRRGQSQPDGAGARGRRLPADRELRDPQIPCRQVQLAGLSQGFAAAGQGQRDHGLVQYQLLSRLWLRLDLPAAFPPPSPAERRGSAGHDRLGQGARRGLAQDPE